MQPNEKIPIKVAIGDKIYPLKVARKDEEFIRTAVAILKRRMEEFKNFEGGETQDRLAWAALDFTTEWVKKSKQQDHISNGLQQELQQLEDLLQGI